MLGYCVCWHFSNNICPSCFHFALEMAPISCRNRFMEHASELGSGCRGCWLEGLKGSKGLAVPTSVILTILQADLLFLLLPCFYPSRNCALLKCISLCSLYWMTIHNVSGLEKMRKKFKIRSLFALTSQFILQEEIQKQFFETLDSPLPPPYHSC